MKDEEDYEGIRCPMCGDPDMFELPDGKCYTCEMYAGSFLRAIHETFNKPHTVEDFQIRINDGHA